MVPGVIPGVVPAVVVPGTVPAAIPAVGTVVEPDMPGTVEPGVVEGPVVVVVPVEGAQHATVEAYQTAAAGIVVFLSHLGGLGLFFHDIDRIVAYADFAIVAAAVTAAAVVLVIAAQGSHVVVGGGLCVGHGFLVAHEVGAFGLGFLALAFLLVFLLGNKIHIVIVLRHHGKREGNAQCCE